jgi:hypothetical protein
MVMPGGASLGSVRANAALNEPLRREPWIETTFSVSAIGVSVRWKIREAQATAKPSGNE